MSKIRRSCSAGEGSSTSITDLPQTILIGIISRVPLRCAKRCSAVCKTWYKLLVKDEATSNYLQHWYGGGGGDDQMSSRRNSSSFALLTNMTTLFPSCSNRLWSWVVAAAYSSAEEDTVGIWPRLMIRPCNDDDNEQRLRYSNEVRGSGGQRMEVVACCNDVLLCEENDSASAYYVWEPVSGEHNWVPLPVISSHHHRNSEQRRRFLYGLASEPDGSFTVVRITASERPTGCVLMHTFSNRSREDSWAWKEHHVDWPAGQEFLWVEHYPQGLVYKGFMFWLGAKHALFGVDLDPRRHPHHPVLITLPPEFRYIGNECLGVCRGSLTIVQMSDTPSPLAAAYVAIWILNHGSSSSRSGNSVDEFCSWSLHKRVSLQQAIGSADPFQRPPTSDLSGDASLPRMGRLKLLGRHPYELDIVYFRVWRTVFSLDLSSKGAPLRRLFVYPSDTYPLNTSMGLPVNSFTFIPQWRPTPIRTFAVDSLFINYLECM
ncbi:unnamed protein product [Linum trigynum]|uniref:F-box domain-containing protein n=1 Tax=Linum trigynum TaxID=586398 RepID=A0AAV2GV33_9ROSI